MKQRIFCICLLMSSFLSVFPQPEKSQIDTASLSSPKILIISSYCAEIDWIKGIVTKITDKLEDKLPLANVRVGYLNLDMPALTAHSMFTLRSILWSYAEASLTFGPEDKGAQSMFPSEGLPDLLVFIGDDGLLFYQSFGILFGKWREIPIVACSVSDYITTDVWYPGMKEDFSSFISIDTQKSIEFSLNEQEKKMVDKDLLVEKIEKDRESPYRVVVDFPLTGVKSKLPIEENLKLMEQLIPDLNEIVWIDNDYYSSNYMFSLIERELSAQSSDIKLSRIYQDRFNTDSIYNEIFKAETNKAYLTYSWNINGAYSKFSDEQIRNLFSNYSAVPLFSIAQPDLSNPYFLGGYYKPHEEFADKTVNLVNRILNGERAEEIPFETVSGGKFMLDQTLLIKYGLLEKARLLPDVEFVRIPPTFYEKNEKLIFTFIIVGTILLGLLIYRIRKYFYTRRIQADFMRYKKLYDKLHLIYGHTLIDVALYDHKGDLVFCVIGGKESTLSHEGHGLFSKNLFENSNLSLSIKDQIRNNESVNTEITIWPSAEHTSSDSAQETYQLIVKPLQEGNEQYGKYVTIAIGLNEIVREREERQRFENLVRFASDSSHIGIAFYDIKKGIGTATRAWYENLNEPLSAGILLPAYMYVVPEDRQLLLDYRDKAYRGEITEPFSRDIRVREKDGTKHWINQHVFVKRNDPGLLVELNVNIDKQKKIENSLRIAKAKAEQSILDTQEFLANINHEIRTPLNSIVGFSAILAASESEEERKEHVSIILKNNKLLMMLIDDIIELSQIDSGQISFGRESVDMGELFERVMKAGYSHLYNKQLDVVLDPDKDNPIVFTDADALYRLFGNLFSNAIKFTEEGSVTLGYRREEERYYFFVKDTGKGISPEEQRRIFKRFDKLDSYVQGTGLGLALCKSIVDNLEGEIGVETELGKGSTFWFALPL